MGPMSTEAPNRMLSLLVCWAIHAGLLMFIGLVGLGLGLLTDPMAFLEFWEPIIGDAVLPFANLIEMMIAGAGWVLLAGLLIAVVTVGGFMRSGWGRKVLVACTWLHVVGLIPALLLLHLKVGFGGIVGAIFLLAELGTGIASVVVLKGSLKIIETEWPK